MFIREREGLCGGTFTTLTPHRFRCHSCAELLELFRDTRLFEGAHKLVGVAQGPFRQVIDIVDGGGQGLGGGGLLACFSFCVGCGRLLFFVCVLWHFCMCVLGSYIMVEVFNFRIPYGHVTFVSEHIIW